MLTGGARIGQVVAHSLALHGCNLALIIAARAMRRKLPPKLRSARECVRSRSEPMPSTKTRLSARSRRPIASYVNARQTWLIAPRRKALWTQTWASNSHLQTALCPCDGESKLKMEIPAESVQSFVYSYGQSFFDAAAVKRP